MKSYSREDSEDGLLSFENISGALQERTGHKVWGGSTLIYSTMAARGEGSADHLLGRGCQSILLLISLSLNTLNKTKLSSWYAFTRFQESWYSYMGFMEGQDV